MERTESLWDGGPCFCYGGDAFPPSTDTFLLGYFTRTRRGERICDLGAGTGLLGVLLLARQPELTVTAVEYRESGCQAIRHAAACNGWEARLIPAPFDLRRPEQFSAAGAFDAVVANPPYFAEGRGAVSPKAARQAARAEVSCTLEDVFRAASWLLRSGGRFSLVMRPERMAEVFALADRFHLAPKRMRTVQFRPGSPPSLFLLECRKDGGAGLTLEAPLYLQDEAGRDTEEYARIYFRARQEG